MSKRPYQFKVFEGPLGGWKWELQAPNGSVIAKCFEHLELVRAFAHVRLLA